MTNQWSEYALDEWNSVDKSSKLQNVYIMYENVALQMRKKNRRLIQFRGHPLACLLFTTLLTYTRSSASKKKKPNEKEFNTQYWCLTCFIKIFKQVINSIDTSLSFLLFYLFFALFFSNKTIKNCMTSKPYYGELTIHCCFELEIDILDE